MFRSLYLGALLSLLLFGFAASYVAVESLAVFSDQTVNAANTFATGTVAISDDPDSAVVSFANMAPGDSVLAPLTISNDGTLELRYAMTSTSTPSGGAFDLRDVLVLTIREEDAGGGCGAQGGAVLYNGAIAAAAFGSPAQGQDPGDRTLAAVTDEVLCFRVELPLATGNDYQDTSTTTTFTFDAEQVANNP